MIRLLIRSAFLVALVTASVAPAAEANLFFGTANVPGFIYETSDDGVLIGTIGAGRPSGIFGQAFDSSGNLFFSDLNGTVTRIAAGTGVESTFATGLSVPTAVAVNGANEVFVTANGGIRRYAANGTLLGIVSGFGVGRLAFDENDTLYIGSIAGELYEFTPNGGTVLLASGLGQISDLEYNKTDGRLYAALQSERAVRVFSTTGAILSSFSAEQPGDVGSPSGLAILPDNTVAVTTAAEGFVRRYNTDGIFLSQFQFTGGYNLRDVEYRAPLAVTVPETGTVALVLPALGMIGAVLIKRRKK